MIYENVSNMLIYNLMVYFRIQKIFLPHAFKMVLSLKHRNKRQLTIIQKILCLLSANCFMSSCKITGYIPALQVLQAKKLTHLYHLKNDTLRVTPQVRLQLLQCHWFYILSDLEKQTWLPNGITIHVLAYILFQRTPTYCLSLSFFLKHHVCPSSCHLELRECCQLKNTEQW